MDQAYFTPKAVMFSGSANTFTEINRPVPNARLNGTVSPNRIWFNLLCLCAILIFGCSLQLAKGQSSDTANNKIYKDFKTEFMWNAKVKVASLIMLGESKRGTRRVIPITGGTFEGPNIRGEVLHGGEDWQLVRPDGDTELSARYLLKTNDGYVIQVINQVLMHMPAKGEKGSIYTRSVIDLEAPTNSPYDYLNHSIFLGTLEMPKMQPCEEPYVIIGVYRLL